MTNLAKFRFQLFANRRKNSDAKRERSTVLVFEPLEDRQLLSVSSPADVAAATALVGSDNLAQDALIRLDDDALATTTDAASGLVVLSEQEMLELVSSNAVPDVQVGFPPETLQLLREVKATGYTAGKRWFYYDKGENGSQWNSSGLTSGDLKDTIDAAAEAGLNGMVWKMDFDDLGTNAGPNESFLTAAKKYADSKHIEIIPTFGFVGGNAFLSRDATLVEGLPHGKIPMKVSGGKASIVADSSVQVADGGMESLNDLNNANPSNQNKWSKTDPSSNYAFKSSVRHSGNSSLLIKPLSNGSTNVVSSGKITVQPGISYTLSCWVKTKVNKIDWNVAEISIWDATREISYNYVDGTTNWHKVELEFQTSDDEITIYLKGTGDIGEEFYFDDVEITAAAKQDFLPIPREGTPVKVYKKVNNAFVPLVENVDWKLPDGYRKNSRGETTYKYNYEYGFYVENNGEWEKSIDIEIPAGSQIHNGDTIYVDYYTPEPNVWNSYAYSVCLSEQGLYDYIGEVVADIQRLIQPKTWFLAFDEITSGGNCETCHNSGLTTAQIFGRSVSKQYDIIKSVDPDAEVVVWSDMLDPIHNALDNPPYQHVDGSLVDAVDYIPSDVIIACWYDSYERDEMTPEYIQNYVDETLNFFSSRGFRTIASTYYDWGGDEHGKGYSEAEMPLTDLDRNTKGWLMAIRDCYNSGELRNNAGVFYTTWVEPGDYDYLPSFGAAFKYLYPMQPNKTITSVSLNTTTPKVGQTLTANLSLSGANAQTAATYQWYRKEYAYDAENNETLDWEIWKKIDNATGASYVVQAGDLGKELKVTAVGVWDYAGTASVETEAVSQAGPTQLSAPANPRETAKTETTITVAWDAVPGATGYRVAWRNKADSQIAYQSVGASTTSYKITGLDNSATYVWKVQAIGGDFTPARTVKPRQILPAPTATATTTAKTITVSWNAVPGAVKYYVSYRPATESEWGADKSAGSNTSYTIKGLNPNTLYYVRVKAIGDNFDVRTSSYSASVRAKTAAQVQLAAPANPDASAKTATTITASWDAVPNATGYRFIWKNQSDSAWTTQTLGASKTSFKMTNLDNNAIYVWKVLAIGDGDGYLNSPYCATQRDKPQQTLAAPANPDAPSKTASTITASWKAVPNATGYRFIWKNQSDASYTTETLSASTTSYKMTNLDNSAVYVWKVLAIGDGVDYVNSSYCATQRDMPLQTLAAPANPDATAKTASTITASWKAVPNATGYRFIWKNQSDASYTTETLSASKTSYKMTNLDNSSVYVWKVLAIGDGVDYANSQYCATQRDKPLQTLAAPVLTVAPATTSLTLSWRAVPNAVGYSVSYRLATEASWSNDVSVGTNLSYTINRLAQNTLYHVRVRAIGDGVDYKSVYSATTRAMTSSASSAVLDSDDAFFDELDEEDFDLLAANL